MPGIEVAATSSERRPRVGLALGVGAARGLAHRAMLAELEARAVRGDARAGGSIGAVVAVSHAAGRRDDLERAARGTTWLRIARLVDLAARGGLINAERRHALLADGLGDATLDAPDPPVTAETGTGRERGLSRGAVVDIGGRSITVRQASSRGCGWRAIPPPCRSPLRSARSGCSRSTAPAR